MESKLVVNFQIGQLEVSGSESLVRTVYDDFKEHLARTPSVQPESGLKSEKKPVAEPSAVKQKTRAKTSSKSTAATVDPDLDLSGLKEFYAQFETKKGAELALIFAVFLRDEKAVSPCSVNALYSCFFALKDEVKLPNMDSLLKNDRTRTKFFRRVDGDVVLTTIGENHFSHELQRSGQEPGNKQ